MAGPKPAFGGPLTAHLFVSQASADSVQTDSTASDLWRVYFRSKGRLIVARKALHLLSLGFSMALYAVKGFGSETIVAVVSTTAPDKSETAFRAASLFQSSN